jgi:hypothetical protein
MQSGLTKEAIVAHDTAVLGLTSIVSSAPEDRSAEDLSQDPNKISLQAEPPQRSTSANLDSIISRSTSAFNAVINKDQIPVSHSPLRFPCPIFQGEIEQDLPHTCDGEGGNTMAELRAHMRQGSHGHPPHLTFLCQCTMCKRDIVDSAIFYGRHGRNCSIPQPKEDEDMEDEQYKALCTLLLKPSSNDIAPPSKCS